MAHLLSFRDELRLLAGYARGGAGSTPFGTVELGIDGPHEVTVCGDGVPTVHVDDVVLVDGRHRVLIPPGRITVDDEVGTLRSQRGLRLTRSGKAITTEVAGRTYDLRMTGLNLVAVTRLGHGRVAGQRPVSRFRLEDRADATDLAIALALVDAISRDGLTLYPGG